MAVLDRSLVSLSPFEVELEEEEEDTAAKNWERIGISKDVKGIVSSCLLLVVGLEINPPHCDEDDEVSCGSTSAG